MTSRLPPTAASSSASRPPFLWTRDCRFDSEPCCGTRAGYHSTDIDECDGLSLIAEATTCFCDKSTSYSTTCTCLATTRQLYTVNKTFGAYAKVSFFRKNRFVITCFRGFIPPNHCTVSEGDLPSFLAAIPQSQCCNIRNLHLRLHLLDYIYSLPDDEVFMSPALRPLAAILGSVSNNFTLSTLNLVLDLTSPSTSRWVSTVEYNEEFGLPDNIIEPAFYGRVFTLQHQIAATVANCLQHQRPQNLWIYLSWPLPPRHDKRSSLEKKFEQMTMGGNYDAVSRGKPPFDFWNEPEEHTMHTLCLPGGCLRGPGWNYGLGLCEVDCESASGRDEI